MQIDYTVDFVFDSFTEGEFVVGMIGADTDDQGRAFFLDMSNPPYVAIYEPSSIALAFVMLGAFAACTRRRIS